jgi:hypothetical protein
MDRRQQATSNQDLTGIILAPKSREYRAPSLNHFLRTLQLFPAYPIIVGGDTAAKDTQLESAKRIKKEKAKIEIPNLGNA